MVTIGKCVLLSYAEAFKNPIQYSFVNPLAGDFFQRGQGPTNLQGNNFGLGAMVPVKRVDKVRQYRD